MGINNSAPIRGNLSTSFKKGLLHGRFAGILQTAIKDPELDIQVRANYLNIYYRGGNILRITSRSLWFDKFYFYLPSEERGKNFPKTYVEHIYAHKEDKIPAKTEYPIPTFEEAKQIINDITKELAKIKGHLPDSPEIFFKEAKDIMNKWFKKWKKEERDDQHNISLANRTFSEGCDLVVVDLEFAVSTLKEYNYAISPRTGNKKVCRFDIVAVDKNGQIYVVELKQNKQADSDQNSANIHVHRKDFDDTIGEDSQNLFAREIFGLVETKKELGLLGQDVMVKISKPIFAISYSGSDANHFYDKYKGGDIPIVHVDTRSKKLCK